MITANEARILLTQNNKLMLEKLEKIKDLIIGACYKGLYEITYECPPEWIEPMEIKLRSYGYTITNNNANIILIKW